MVEQFAEEGRNVLSCSDVLAMGLPSSRDRAYDD